MTPEQFLNLLPQTEKQAAFLLGAIPPDYTSGHPTVIIDGESTATTRTWPYLASYTPTAGDRVLIGVVGHSGVILGAVI